MRSSRAALWLFVLTLFATQLAFAQEATPELPPQQSDFVMKRGNPWQLSGTVSPNRDDISVWIMDLRGWRLVEAQTGLFSDADGKLVTAGEMMLRPNSLDAVAKYPLKYGHVYQAVVYDPGSSSYFYGNFFTTGSCMDTQRLPD
jgi:hypothetical protein